MRLKTKSYYLFSGFLTILTLLPLIVKAQPAPSPTATERAIDSLQALLKTDKQDTAKVTHLGALSRQYRTMGNTQDAIETGSTAIKIAERSGDKTFMARAYDNMANVFYYMGNLPAALEDYLQALATSESVQYKEGIASANLGAGNVYKDEAQYAKALDYYLKALQQNTEAKRLKGMSACYGNIGIVYWNMSNYQQALSFYLKALDIDQQLNDKSGIAADLSNIGNVYTQSNDTAKALDNYKKALNLYASIGNKHGIAVLTSNIGDIYLKQKNNKQAEKYFTASVNMAKAINDLQDEKYCYMKLSDLYASQGDWQKAYQNHIYYTIAVDSLTNYNNARRMVSAEMTYEFQKKQAVLKAEQDKKDAIINIERKRQKIVTAFIALVALFIALIALFIFRQFKAAKREKLLAEQQKSMMELKALRAQMNPHFIFNAINSIQHFILKNEPDAAQKHLNKFSKLIRKVLENSKQESIPLSEEIEMLQLYTELELVRFSSKFKYKFAVSDKLSPENIMVPPLIIQPFIENAIWHGLMHLKERQGELLITFDKENDMLSCTIDDNGIGRKRSQELRDEARHQPMGLSITHERVNVLNEAYHLNISLRVTDKTNTDGSAAGTSVKLLMPLNFNKAHA